MPASGVLQWDVPISQRSRFFKSSWPQPATGQGPRDGNGRFADTLDNSSGVEKLRQAKPPKAERTDLQEVSS